MRCKPADLLSGWPTAAHAFASALCAAARSRAGQLSRAQWLKAATNVVRAAQRQRPSEGEHCGASEGTSVILILRQEVAQAGAEGEQAHWAEARPRHPGRELHLQHRRSQLAHSTAHTAAVAEPAML